jgi:hypothetical protein
MSSENQNNYRNPTKKDMRLKKEEDKEELESLDVESTGGGKGGGGG